MRWNRVFYPGVFGLLVYAAIRLVTDVPAGEHFWQRPLRQNAIEVAFTILMGYLFHAVLLYANKRFGKVRQLSFQKLALEFVVLMLAVAGVLNPVVLLIHYLANDPVDVPDLVIANCIGILSALLYYAIVRGNFLLRSHIDQTTKLERMEKEQIQTELKFLKAQYHPHFLFNAINTVYFQMDEDVAGAKRTLESFSKLLRYQLYDQQQMVTLRQELEHLQHFIRLQQQRSSDRLKLSIELDETLGDEKLYPLLLLPLVENAFKYVGGEYKLLIKASKNGGGICFLVQNDLPVQQRTDGGRIGLENLRRRLQLLYPGKHCLETKKEEHSFTAMLTIQLT
jgi:signal transduction histidine kinase